MESDLGGNVAVRNVVGLIVLLSCAGTAVAQPAEVLFPRPAELAPAVRFWTRVYTEVDTSSGFLHDPVNLDVVYDTLRFTPSPSSRDRRRATERATAHYRAILTKLASNDRSALSTDEARVLALWPADTSRAELRAAADRIRFQLGQADRFRAGLERSGRWKTYIEQVLVEKGVPRELAALPHVESSFDPTAYSKVGAAGLWQFTRSTGLRYMQIDHIVDERRDPFLSTHAAAQLLSDNYSVIQSWPLAITAYNHGLAGMRRAVEQQNSTDIGVIVRNYKSRIFGFASRNFYAAFLAAVDVDANYERYFDRLDFDSPENLAVIVTPDYVEAATIARALNVPGTELARLNPALMETVWAGEKLVPRGFELRIPARSGTDPVTLLASIPNEARFAAQRPDLQHRVRSGETLSVIAQRYRVSVASLIRANGLNDRGFIRAGQMLNLPQAGNVATLAVAAAVPPSAADASAARGGEYVVQRGDSIDRIARRLGVDQAELLSANDVGDRNRIYVGQVLRLPGEPPTDVEVLPAVAVAVADVLLPPAAADEPVLTAAIEPPAAAESILTAAEAAAGATAPPVAIADIPAVDAEAASALLLDTENAETDLQSNVLASTQATLAADPSDYTVAANGTIEVHDVETLGHYADWLEIRTQRLRDLNGMAFGQAVVVGQRISLDFSRVDMPTFEQRRVAYHEQHQEEFFRTYQIADIREHVIRPGQSVWVLAQRTYKVPVWLLRQYNPDLDLERVAAGTVVKFPELERIGPEGDAV
jgi:membrane-bound lytic murein transglycosylase D